MRPYVSSRAGRLQWLMQRVSAVLLLVLAGGHFFMQHFTADAVSTGLTVAARFDDRLFQAYYVIFISLALYHGVNGLVGIIADYCPPRPLRSAVNVILWTATAFFLAIAIINIADAPSLGESKAWYTEHGFSAGESRGNPPTLAKSYDFREEMRELHLLGFYLEHHTAGAPEAIGPVFGNAGTTATGDETALLAAQGGLAFENWAREVIAKGEPKEADRDRSAMFSSTYEFAVWALNVRKANAKGTANTVVANRLASVPPYSPSLH